MTTAWMVLNLITAVGCALVAGGFFVFSTFILQGLDRLAPSVAVAAMNEINVTAVRPPFMILIFGTAIGCVAVIVGSFASGGQSTSIILTVAGSLYLLLPIGLTVAFHVPRNNALARVRPDDSQVAEIWSCYRRDWLGGNHVRTAGALAAAVLMIVGLTFN